jgi:hypothetical protein
MIRSTRNRTARPRRHALHPRLDALEGRTLLSTVSWINTSGGDWDTPSDWSTGTLPRPSDDVVISTAAITVTHSSSASDSVKSLTISSSTSALDISNGTLALASTSSVAGTISIEGATLSTSGYLAVAGPFNNNGTVDVQAGTLDLHVGSSATVAGRFTGAAGTTMVLRYQDLAPTASISGDSVEVDGNVRCPFTATSDTEVDSNATFTNPATHLSGHLGVGGGAAFRTGNTFTLAGLDVGNGLSGSDSFIVTGTMNWYSAIAADTPGGLTIDAEGTLNIVGQSAILDGAVLNNTGTATWTGTSAGGSCCANTVMADGAVFNNTGTFIDQSLPNSIFGLSYSGQDGSGVFNNAGTFVKPTATDTTFAVPFNNTGSVDVQAGTLDLHVGATNSGGVVIESGATLAAGTGCCIPYTQTAGTTVLNGGTINSGPIFINGGSLSGSGTINASGLVTNRGQVIPGGTGAAGTLSINGNYTQTATGTLDIDIAGTAAGSQYDQLAISGTAALGGSLDVALLNGFQPALGNTFQVLTFASSSGNFHTYNGTSQTNGLFLDPVFQPTNLMLDVDQVAISGAPALPLPGVPIHLAGSVTGPSAGNPSVFSYAWTVTQNGNPYQAGSGSSFSFTPNLVATYVAALTVTDATGGKGMTTLQLVVPPSIFVLNPTANVALSVAGGASITIPGGVVVDSSSASAISLTGKSQLSASVIDVLGGVKTGTGSSVNPAPATGVSIPDPLAALTSPSPAGMNNYGSISLTKGSQTINPGVYSQIKVSNGASLTLNPGLYIIEGGGLTVTGSASISSSGVMIYNAGSNYPSSGGKFGGITFSSTGTISLSAPTSGPYAGVLIFQSRENTLALSLSGNALSGMSGTIYAPSALLSLTGSAQLQQGLVVGMLSVSGPIALTQIAAGSDGWGDSSGIANTLLAGNLSVYINDPSALFASDELARIQDAINAWDAILAPYSVTITEVSDPTLANMVIDTSTTSACGGVANGVLGCFNAPNSEITLIQGWNWYAGSDPTQIGTNQYDFETTVLHELGHALGLGGSTNPSSPMYEVLAAGVAERTVTTQDLNIPDPPAGADPQMASGPWSVVRCRRPPLSRQLVVVCGQWGTVRCCRHRRTSSSNGQRTTDKGQLKVVRGRWSVVRCHRSAVWRARRSVRSRRSWSRGRTMIPAAAPRWPDLTTLECSTRSCPIWSRMRIDRAPPMRTKRAASGVSRRPGTSRTAPGRRRSDPTGSIRPASSARSNCHSAPAPSSASSSRWTRSPTRGSTSWPPPWSDRPTVWPSPPIQLPGPRRHQGLARAWRNWQRR